MNLVAVHRVSLECVSRFSLIHRESGEGFSGRRIVNSRGRNRPIRRLHAVTAGLITSAESFEVGRLIGSYGFMNVTSYTGLQSGSDFEYTSDDIGRLKSQDIGEGGVKIRLYEGRISQGPFRGTPIVFKVYPGQRAGGVEADMMAANELNAHSFLQSKSLPANLLILVGGFETQLGEQWLAFRDGGKDSAADYAQTASEKTSRARSQGVWNPYEKEQMMKRRRNFVIKILQGAMKGLAFMHDNDRLHQSLGPSSIVLNTPAEREAIYLIPRLRDLAFSVDIRPSCLEEGATSGSLSEQLWRRATAAGAFTVFEKRAFGIADDIYEAGLLFAYLAFVPFCEAGVMDSLSLQRLLENTFRLDIEAVREYCLADERLEEAVKFLDLGDRAGWELLQAMLNADHRKRPMAEAVLSHRFLNGVV
ncbi:Protein kinase-like domain superfamily [Arabidopsis suecica]|uniref:Protein kinase-like domain superfamily n=1 Tax=Arabidopsis suecica TaxID=45249 RepID=A0A8T1ZB89_ARASU|nr:Protein kinase-like domain superfamily [Arabidopsis suecica]